MEGIGILILWGLVVGAGIYIMFLPVFIASNKKNIVAVSIITIFTGWTIVGWIIALVMAINAPSDKDSKG